MTICLRRPLKRYGAGLSGFRQVKFKDEVRMVGRLTNHSAVDDRRDPVGFKEPNPEKIVVDVIAEIERSF